MSSSSKVLVFAAHPDDEVLGCGGIMAEYQSEGVGVCVCIATDGSSSQYPNDEKIAQQKDRESIKANKYLGVEEIIRLDLPDMKLDTVPHMKLNNMLNEVVEKIKPNIIYTHSSVDINKDHYCINRSLMVVVRPEKLYLSKVYEYEVLSSTEWSRDISFCPNTFVRLGKDSLAKKQRAFEFYKTEARAYPHPRSSVAIETLARYRGIQAGYEYAEAFKLLIEFQRKVLKLYA